MRPLSIAAALLLTPAASWSQTETQIIKPAPSTGFLKHLTIESFGYTRSPVLAGYEFAPTNMSAFYNLHGLNCPLCIVGPPLTRTRAVLPPFGAKMTSNFWHDRIILFAGFGGIDSVPTDNTPRLSPLHMRATSFNDDWFVTTDIGAHINVDPGKDLAVGVTRSYVNEFGPTRGHRSQTTGDININYDLFQELAHGIWKAEKHSMSR